MCPVCDACLIALGGILIGAVAAHAALWIRDVWRGCR
jgi:hypothetical protein